MAALHVGGTRRLVDAAAGKIGRWVQLSSVGAYGPQRTGVVTEQTVPRPQGVYESTKAAADALVEAAALQGAFSHVILRPSIVYGGDMSNASLFGLISMVERGMFFFVGPEGASANYIHVDNVIDALMRCGAAPEAAGRVYNLSDHRSMERFVGAIAAALGRNPPRLRLPSAVVRVLAATLGRLPGVPLTAARVDALTNRAVYPSARIERELGYRHILSMEEGLQELVAAWRRRHE
jgi:nucleoside-diphosphate-sugar epimerase